MFEVGDESYPFVAILEGEVAITDASGREIVRHGSSGFLGEINLLSGQTVFLTAVVTEPTRYIAVEREVFRRLLFEDGALSDLLLSAFVERRELLQQREGIGIEIVGPRDSSETRRLLDFARRLRLPHSWLDPEESEEAAGVVEQLDPEELPAGPTSRRGRARRRATESSRGHWGSGSSWSGARRSTCSWSAAGRPVSARPSTAPRRASTRS